jgi:hypothetical protein
MSPTDAAESTNEDLDAVASQIYCDWPVSALLTDGHSYNLLVERVMANIGAAVRGGALPAPGSSEQS